MRQKDIELSKMRIEKSKLYSGICNDSKIKILKNECYYTINISMDGDAPKEYIKGYFYYKNCPRKNKPKSWAGFYAKFGGKSYPYESITEYCINQIGIALGLKMNETFLVNVNTQIRFLSKDFIKAGKTKLIHGVEILHEYFEDKEFVDEINKDRKKRREFLTFDVIEDAVRHVHPKQSEQILRDLIKLIVFDAIVGNNDRHFYNWGIIGYIKKDKNRKVEFTPIYDSARALLWNSPKESLDNLYFQVKHGSKQLDSFINRSKPRFSFEGNPSANHFQLMEYLIKHNKDYAVITTGLVSVESEKKVFLHLKSSVFHMFSEKRKYLISEILKLRFSKLRGLLDD